MPLFFLPIYFYLFSTIRFNTPCAAYEVPLAKLRIESFCLKVNCSSLAYCVFFVMIDLCLEGYCLLDYDVL